MTLINEFLTRYRREVDFFEHAARLVAQILDINLQSAGIRAIVTDRVKTINRLEHKIKQRANHKKYSTIDDIYNDIVDLAGVRVALYFPGELKAVDILVRKLFTLFDQPKQFPSDATPTYIKRFTGYRATHYHVQIPDHALSDAQKRYSTARVEIQVASVLMHAWSEVEHDLVYKPSQGRLSEEEYAILDELNGLVLVGEIGLERLQRAGETRVITRGRQFLNHYDLAAFLIEKARSRINSEDLGDTGLGRIDLLFRFISKINLNTPEKLEPLIEALHSNIEQRPVSEQIIDQILAKYPKRYAEYESVRSTTENGIDDNHATLTSRDTINAVGDFIAGWIELEKIVRLVGNQAERQSRLWPSYKVIEQLNLADQEIKPILNRLREFRNNLVHGVETPDSSQIRKATEDLIIVLGKLKSYAKDNNLTRRPKVKILIKHR